MKWAQQTDFKSCTRLFEFHFALISLIVYIYIYIYIMMMMMMAKSRAESIWDIYNYEKCINQFLPNRIKSIWQYEKINKKICRQKMSIMFNEICIYIYIYIYILLIISQADRGDFPGSLSLSLSLSIRPNHQSLPAGPLKYIQFS